MAVKKFRLIAGVHVGPDAQGVVRQWSANSQFNVIETHQDLATLNVNGFPPKFQPLHEAPLDRDGLLKKREEIERQLEQMDRDMSGGPPIVEAPLAGVPQPPAVVPLRDPRDAITPAAAAREARASAARGVLNACERMNDQELLEYCDAEEIPHPEGADRAELMAAVANVYSPRS